MRRAVGLAALVLGGLLSCQEAERPGWIADLPAPEPEPGSLVDPSPDQPPDLASPCGAATVGLEFLRPNLYFAIDASGSMREDIPRADATATPLGTAPLPSDRYAVLSMAIQGLLERIGHRVNYGATLFPSGAATCDAGEEILGLSQGDRVSSAVSGELGPVLRDLMFSINRRIPSGGTPVALALGGLAAKLRGRGSETYLFLVTDGGPNCNPSFNCGPEACIPNIEHVSLTEELRCEAPLNCCDPGLAGPQNCLDASASEAAVSALAQAGIRTIVIGIPGSEAYADVLDRLALAGGMARPESPNYYRVSDAEQLVTTVGSLGLGVALSCGIELAEPPPDPSLVNVYFDGQIVPADPVDGWAFVDARTVQLLGNACELLKTGQVLQADIVAGCPVVIR